jgi:hypothetical protein
MILALLTVFSGFTCGESPMILDTGFDLWCGNHLCAWEVTAGNVRRVSTWHRSDYGAEMVGNPAEISQLALGKADCLEFRLQVDRDDGVDLYIEMDFQDDGTTEYSHPIPTTDFKPANYRITPPSWYQSVRFIIRKTGPGRAVLAQVWVVGRNRNKCTAPSLGLGERPLGAVCESDDQCAVGRCVMVESRLEVGYRCGECRANADCSGDDVCGLGQGEEGFYLECIPAASHSMGDLCFGPDECVTGLCCGGICSQCCDDQDCPLGSCRMREAPVPGGDGPDYVLLWWSVATQCSPGEGKGSTGDVCLFDDDCQSGACAGAGDFAKCGECLDMSDEDDVLTCFIKYRYERCQSDEDCQDEESCVYLGTVGGVCR